METILQWLWALWLASLFGTLLWFDLLKPLIVRRPERRKHRPHYFPDTH